MGMSVWPQGGIESSQDAKTECRRGIEEAAGLMASRLGRREGRKGGGGAHL